MNNPTHIQKKKVRDCTCSTEKIGSEYKKILCNYHAKAKREDVEPSFVLDGDEFYPAPDCGCSLCRSGELCDACEDFGCQIDDFAV